MELFAIFDGRRIVYFCSANGVERSRHGGERDMEFVIGIRESGATGFGNLGICNWRLGIGKEMRSEARVLTHTLKNLAEKSRGLPK
jgi:hypothetical protein